VLGSNSGHSGEKQGPGQQSRHHNKGDFHPSFQPLEKTVQWGQASTYANVRGEGEYATNESNRFVPDSVIRDPNRKRTNLQKGLGLQQSNGAAEGVRRHGFLAGGFFDGTDKRKKRAVESLPYTYARSRSVEKVAGDEINIASLT